MSPPGRYEYETNTSLTRGDEEASVGRHTEVSAAPHAAIAMGLAVVSLVSTPLLLLFPIIGFLPAIIAAAGVVVAWLGLRKSTRGTAVALVALIFCVVLLGLTASIATLWHVVVVSPAVSDYDQLHQVIEYIKELMFGS
ncbi:hypothetical protein CIK75_01420 [Glutamicibacter sp. BW78]|nr:hypothetical protein CIK75_01420 [Glutamicibacter sp. BW78]